ncbi:polysaccharide deacetylase family protein [Streptomyces sp. TRM 70351]|uniref:polysaccharide deacetylase family protein n=1 Tax=Streptomyces sp. TRM 70351 TaxID=3116552 RepID=UPI002E7B0812|nr:polysaccharide deacetylase family protein [Streptomyces sp. TRM 70351]MEE1928031.1 polysaccharide deacetylase family protein [Streptomyces sp. TRM 70351]
MTISRQVTQNYWKDGQTTAPDGRDAPGTSHRSWHHVRRAVGASAVVLLAVSCAATAGLPGGTDGRARLDQPLAAAGAAVPLGTAPHAEAGAAAASLTGYAERLRRAELRRVAAAKRWGLAEVPLRPPAPPDRRPELASDSGHLTGDGLPPVITRVPTTDRVVFLTVDDGYEKDPAFPRMLRELDLPYSAFIADYVASDDYGYFRRMHRDGAAVHNHTLNHKELPRLSYEHQRREICGMQEVLEREIGQATPLFRPPYGAYDRDTLRAAAACGIRAVPLWAEEAWALRFDWGRADRRFHPGDIILTHFRGPEEWGGTMTDMLRRTLRTVTEQGFALARLEDYL